MFEAGAWFGSTYTRRMVNLSLPNLCMLWAAQVWMNTCPQAGASPQDFALKGSDGPVLGPFDWSLPTEVGMDQYWVRTGEAWSVAYHNSDPIKRTIAERLALLAPGSHVVRLLDPHAVARLHRRIGCFRSNRTMTFLPNVMLGEKPVQFTIPEQGCATQFFQVVASQGQGTFAGLSFD